MIFVTATESESKIQFGIIPSMKTGINKAINKLNSLHVTSGNGLRNGE